MCGAVELLPQRFLNHGVRQDEEKGEWRGGSNSQADLVSGLKIESRIGAHMVQQMKRRRHGCDIEDWECRAASRVRAGAPRGLGLGLGGGGGEGVFPSYHSTEKKSTHRVST